MNPHDPAKRPGAHLVAEILGDEGPWTLNIACRPNEPLYGAATLVIGAAHHLDELRGRPLSDCSNPSGEANSTSPSWYAPLRSAVQQISQLVSRQSAAYERLAQSIFAYRRLPPKPDDAQPSNAEVRSLNDEQVPGQHDSWAISGDRPLQALEGVEAGGLRFHQSAVYGYIYLSDGRGQRPNPEVWPETVQRLVADGLLDQDTGEGLYRPGQLLSLTPQGEMVLRAARTATPRESAALRRSNSAVISGAAAVPSAAAATSTATMPSGFR